MSWSSKAGKPKRVVPPLEFDDAYFAALDAMKAGSG